MKNEKKTQARFCELLCELRGGLYEKDDVLALSLLASLAGEGIFMLGPPGVGKSLIARRLKFAWSGASVFEYLMSRFSTPDEVFGPVSISKLKNDDSYERSINGFLPGADIVFLDEIWKAGPAIQNALLTVLNEKIFRNGNYELRVPLKTLIAASNGLPAEGEGLEALWDRFLLRVRVSRVNDGGLFIKMIEDTSDALCDTVRKKNKITQDEYEKWQNDFNEIILDDSVKNIILILRESQNDICVSDRRWKKIARLLRVCAFVHDRKKTNRADALLIYHCLWNKENDFEAARERVFCSIEKEIATSGDDFSSGGWETIGESIAAFDTEVRNATRVIEDTRQTAPELVNKKFYRAKKYGESAVPNFAFIQKDDYQIIEPMPKTIKLYKEIKLSKGYSVQKSDPYITFDREAEVSRTDGTGNAGATDGAGQFEIIIDGEIYNIVTKSTGDKRRVKKRAEKRQEALWDKRVNEFNTLISSTQKKFDTAQKDIKNSNHIFVPRLDINMFVERIKNISAELDSLALQTAAVKHLYSGFEEGYTILDS